MQACPIAWSDVLAWRTLTGARPKNWELRAIFKLDHTFLTFEPEKAPDGAPMVEGTADNMKAMLRGMAGKPATAPAAKGRKRGG